MSTPPLFEATQPSLLVHMMTRDPEPFDWSHMAPSPLRDRLVASDIHGWTCDSCEYSCDSERSARWHEETS